MGVVLQVFFFDLLPGIHLRTDAHSWDLPRCCVVGSGFSVGDFDISSSRACRKSRVSFEPEWEEIVLLHESVDESGAENSQLSS